MHMEDRDRRHSETAEEGRVMAKRASRGGTGWLVSVTGLSINVVYVAWQFLCQGISHLST